MTTHEEIAFHLLDNILWLAHRTVGDGEEIAYVEGWDLEGKEGLEACSLVAGVLQAQFVPSSKNIFPRFVGCKKAHLDKELPAWLLGVIAGVLGSVGVECDVTEKPPRLSFEDISARWNGPLGEPLQKSDRGYTGALRVMTGALG